jgi:hypothetical protein
MTSVIRYGTVTNTTGAPLTATSGLIIDGKDGGEKTFKRIFAAADIGTGANQTRDNTDPTKGCLLFTIQGAKFIMVKSSELLRPEAATNQTFYYKQFATAANYFKYGFRFSPDGYSLYLHDAGDNAATRLIADDELAVTFIFGNY